MQTTAEFEALTFSELQELDAHTKSLVVRSGLATVHECETCEGFGYIEDSGYFECETCLDCMGEGRQLWRPEDIAAKAQADADAAERRAQYIADYDHELDWEMF